MVTTSALRLASSASPSTQASTVYDRLREDLLSGKLEPGRKLQMRFLTEMYQTGQTPLREALNRLTADGLVECREQRGFCVADISRNELVELTKTRCWVESLALRESMAAATPQWEELLLLAEHRLGRTPRSLNTEHFEDNPDWERLHGAFHRTFIGNCGSQSLIAFCGQLTDLQISAPVNPESLSIQTCGRRTSSDHVSRIEWKGGRCRGFTQGTLPANG